VEMGLSIIFYGRMELFSEIKYLNIPLEGSFFKSFCTRDEYFKGNAR
jgi:hypothetical protein